uniref:Uncharacterized protein n=1 Tax=Tanacetum cinerariifolium TaxID=118510 RepID=A0A6L2LUS8_TANCI|nr:hypothetical protein [Tanacetum cinerariifolium]
MEAQPEITQNLSSLKLPMLKTGDYDLWSMRMEQYLTHTDYALWEVIINGDSPVSKPPAVGTVVSLKTIKIRFRGNKESKKMHKTILKEQYENFVASRSKGLEKTYDRESSSSSNSLNVAFVSSENTSSINETVNAARDIPATVSKEQPSASSYADDVMFSFFASQSNTLQLYNKDLEQIDTDNLEEMDLKWQVAMITIRVKKFIKKTGRNLNFNGKEPVGFDGLSRYDWSYQAEEGPTDFALMAHSSDSTNSSNSEVQSCSNECLQSFKNLQKQYDQQNEILNKVNLEILGYQYGLESLEDRIHVHQKNEIVFEESIAFLKYDIQLSENEIPKCEIFEVASDNSVSEIDEDNNQAKDTYKVAIGYHVVPPPYTGNYMPPRADISFVGLDNFVNFVPTTVATKSGQVLVNAAKQSSTASTSTTRPKVNTAAIRPNVNVKSSYFKPHSPKRRHFNQKSTTKTNTFPRKINTAKGKNVTTVGPKAVVNDAEGNKENAVKSLSCWIWRLKGKLIDHTSKNSRSYTLNKFNYVDPNDRVNAAMYILLLLVTIKTANFLLLIIFTTAAYKNMYLTYNKQRLLKQEIAALKKKVTKLNKWRKSRSRGLRRLKKFGSCRRVKPSMEKDSLGAQEDASKQGRMIEEIDQNAEIALDDETQGKTNDDEMFRVDDLAREEVVMDTTTGEHEEQIIEDVSTAEPVTTAEYKPKVVVQEQEMSTTILAAATTVTTVVPTPRAKGIVFHEQKQSQIPTISSSKDKGKARMLDPKVPIKKKIQMRIDEEYARKLEAKELEAVQKARLLVELIEKRKKHFAALRAQEKRNKPPTKTQMKSQMSTYLKHMGGYNQSHLKGRSFDEIKKFFDREMRKVNDFIAMDSEAQKSSAKEVDENVKPVTDDFKKLKKCMEIVLDDGDEVLIEAIPLSSKSPTIIDYKIHKEGKKTYFKIIRLDDYALWEVIINGDSLVHEPPAVGTVVSPKTKAQKLARKNELKAKSTLLLAIPDEHLLMFHSIKDAKSLWEAIKIRSEGLDKTYGWFQRLISQLELNGEVISQEDANMKLLRSLPLAWNNIALIMRNKPYIETLSMDDLYNNLKKTWRNLNFNGKEPVGFDKTRVECYNFHRRGHFARECHAPRNQGNRSGDNERRVVPVETPASALVVHDGLGGYD